MVQNKQKITVSIIPTYRCFWDCSYCYLSELSKMTGNICEGFDLKLYKRLNELVKKYDISAIELYGGDLSVLPITLLEKIISTCKVYCKNIHVTWNDIEAARSLGLSDEQINISINPERKDFLDNTESILRNPNVGIITVVTSRVLGLSEEELFNMYDQHTGNVTFMPFSNTSRMPEKYVTNYEYSCFMIRILSYYFEHRNKFKFNITNVTMLRDCLRGLYNPAMRNNIFLTPNCKFACVDFDDNGQEHFHAFNSLELWEQRCSQEDFDRAHYCGTCEN